jgi:phosphate transport system permease protein
MSSTKTTKRSGARNISRKIEGLIHFLWFICAIFSIVVIFCILGFLIKDALPAFQEIGFIHFITGGLWNPSSITPTYGAAPLIVGTLLVTAGAMILAVPFGLASAIYIAELATPRAKALLKPAIELLAGIPSVVYGFFGLIVLVKFIQDGFGIPSGESVLAGSILLAIMALPTIISVSEDALSATPRFLKEGSLALGATHWQTIGKVLVPAALPGITAAIILGMGRAVGETMAVIMVTGNAGIIPSPIWNIFSPVRTLTGTLGIEVGEVAIRSMHYHALFGLAFLLLLITFVINLLSVYVMDRFHRTQSGNANEKKGFSKLCGEVKKRCLEKIPEVIKREKYLCFFLIVLGILFISEVTFAVALLILIGSGYLINSLCSRNLIQKIWFFTIFLLIAGVIAVLIIILYDIFSHGLPYVTWEFLTQPPSRLGREGGIYPAIVGTLYLVLGSILIALPFGVGAAIWLVEYTKENVVTRIIRTATDLLNGTPSIVFGLFGFTFLVLFMNLGVSLIAGVITLALMILPTIIRTTEEALRSVPNSIREGSLALGVSKWQTIRRVVLPPALPGIITGTILSIGRAAGETAPIMFTAVVFMQRRLPGSVFDPVMALPYHLFILATNVSGARGNQYATAVVLILLVTMIYGAAIVVRHHFSKNVRW